MQITEIRIKLMEDPNDRLQAFCSITFDECFVVRDLKIIQGAKGSFVAMPSRKLTDRCPRCNAKNHLRAEYCNQCGVHLDQDRALKDEEGRAKLYADIAHPINSECREMIQNRVIEAYQQELIRAKQPGYTCTYDDYGEEPLGPVHEPAQQQTVTVASQNGDASHRIEPASQQPAGPHHDLREPSERHESPAMKAHESEDNFGAGIS